MKALSPDEVMARISAALPSDCRPNVIIVGSLAAGYHFFAGDAQRSIRTKDVDCMFSPHAKAVVAAEQVTERLLSEAWTARPHGEFKSPGNASTALKDLPGIRLLPPDGEDGWFLELLSAPGPDAPKGREWHRVHTSHGDFVIPSFEYLKLAECEPLTTKYAVRIARPEMMALSNMLHHQTIGTDVILGTQDKRSNKDLGRVLALAWLTSERDRRDSLDELASWASRMGEALRTNFPDTAKELALAAGMGVRELMRSSADRDKALALCNKGLLASLEVTREAFNAIGRRFIQQVVEPLEESAQAW